MESAGTETAQSTVQVRTTVFVLVFVHLTIDWLAPAVLYRGSSTVIPMAAPCFLGLLMGQMGLLAVWISLGSDPFIRRFLVCLAATVAIVFAALIGGQATGDEFSIADSPADVLHGGIMFVAGMALLQIPFWFLARWGNWQLVAPGAKRVQRRPALQFDLRFIIGGTSAIAFTLGVGRLLIPPDAFSIFRQTFANKVFGTADTWATFLVMNMIVVPPCVWGSNSVKPIALLLSGWLVFLILLSAIFLSVIEAPMIAILTNGPAFLALLVVNVAQCVSIFVSLRVLRQVGFRLTSTACAK